MTSSISLTDATTFMDARKAQGWNTLMVELMSRQQSGPIGSPPMTFGGQLPFLKTTSGATYAADIVILAIGVRPEVGLARAAGLRVRVRVRVVLSPESAPPVA